MDEYGLGDLNITPPAYNIVSFGPGATAFRRQTVQSQYAEGEALTHAVKDIMTSVLVVRVRGNTPAQQRSRLVALTRAFEQLAYELEIVIDGQVSRYACQAADWAVGADGIYNKFLLMARQEEVAFNIPRQPTPVEGIL